MRRVGASRCRSRGRRGQMAKPQLEQNHSKNLGETQLILIFNLFFRQCDSEILFKSTYLPNFAPTPLVGVSLVILKFMLIPPREKNFYNTRGIRLTLPSPTNNTKGLLLSGDIGEGNTFTETRPRPAECTASAVSYLFHLYMFICIT